MHGEEHEQRQRRGDDDVARDGEGAGDEPDHVDGQDEHEQREHEREEFHPLGAGGAFQRVGDEFVGEFRDRLHAAGHQARAHRGAEHQQRDASPTAISMNSAELVKAISWPPIWPSGDDLLDLELLDRIGHGQSSAHLSLLHVAAPKRPQRLSRRRREPLPGATPCRTHDIQHARGKSQAAGRRSGPTAKFQASDRAASRASLRPSRLRPARWRAGSRAPSPKDRRPVWLRNCLGSACRPGVEPSLLPRLRSLADRAASSAGRFFDPFLSRAPSAMLSTLALQVTVRMSLAAPKAARTILRGYIRVKKSRRSAHARKRHENQGFGASSTAQHRGADAACNQRHAARRNAGQNRAL